MSARTILITGGSGKFGRIMVANFLSQGDRVITTCRTADSLSKLQEDMACHGQGLIGIESDLTQPGAALDIVKFLDDQKIQPDCLVNNARSTQFLKIEADGVVSRENFANEFLLDVIVPYELSMGLAAQKHSRMRSVINIGSMYGTVAANPHLYTDPTRQSPLHYGVAKAALSHLTKELAVRLADKHIRVNCVAFGGVEGRVDDAFKQRYSSLCPMGRMLREDEIIGPIELLMSDNCSAVTGQTLSADGGWCVW
jgi:NAD(P)-dependent dehydrogenase (short-subunit alcohol dehydrogenase family)